MNVISQEELTTYESLVQEATREYRNLVDSNRWEPATSKEKSQDQISLPKAYTVSIYQSINKALKQVDFKSHRSGNGSGSVGGLYARSDINCHKFCKDDHLMKYCASNGNGSGINPPKNLSNELPE